MQCSAVHMCTMYKIPRSNCTEYCSIFTHWDALHISLHKLLSVHIELHLTFAEQLFLLQKIFQKRPRRRFWLGTSKGSWPVLVTDHTCTPLISIYAYYALHSGSNLCPSWLSRAVNMLRRGVFNTYLAFNVYLVHYQTLFCTDIVHFFHVLIPIYMQWYLCFRCTSYPSHFYILDCWRHAVQWWFIYAVVVYMYSVGLYAGLCAAVVSDLRSTG